MKAYRIVTYVSAPYMPGHVPPVMAIVEADVLSMPIEEFVTSQPGQLVLYDELESNDDGGLPGAVAASMIRAHERGPIEDNMATLYFYNAQMLTVVLKPDGTLINPRPAPLSVEDIVTVANQLRYHPNYKHQTVVTTSVEGGVVTLEDGRVRVE